MLKSSMVLKAYRYRLYPNKVQAEKLVWTLTRLCEVYNRALAARQDARDRHQRMSYYVQAVDLTRLRQEQPELRELHSAAIQDALRRLDRAFAGFFKRVKNGETPGYPHYRRPDRYNSMTFPHYRSSVFESDREGWGLIYIPKMGYIRVRLHRPLGGEVKTLTVKREGREWYVIAVCAVASEPVTPSGADVGIDLGLTSFVATSDGGFIPAPKYARAAEKKVRRAQRALARKKKGSVRRSKAKGRVAKHYAKVRRQRRDFHHKLAHSLVTRYDTIAHEALNIQNLQRGRLAKSIGDAGWRQFLGILTFKAECAEKRVVAVDPKHTSQTCPACGAVKKKALSERTHSCPCGCELDRDTAAAQVILARALTGWARVAPSSVNAAVGNAHVARAAFTDVDHQSVHHRHETKAGAAGTTPHTPDPIKPFPTPENTAKGEMSEQPFTPLRTDRSYSAVYPEKETVKTATRPTVRRSRRTPKTHSRLTPKEASKSMSIRGPQEAVDAFHELSNVERGRVIAAWHRSQRKKGGEAQK